MNWLKQTFSRRRLHTDLSEEIRAHLEEKIEELVASGMPRKEASAAARRQFGNLTLIQEDSRAVWRWPSLENFFMDVRYALRMMCTSPAFTAIVTLTLALGIGASTAIFSFVDAVIIRPLPYPNSDELVTIDQLREQTRIPTGVSAPNILDVKSQNQVFQEVGFFHWERYFLGKTTSAGYLLGAATSANFLKLLGVEPILGRSFTLEEAVPGHQQVALLSYRLWQSQFAGRRDVVGQTIHLDGHPYTVIGVMSRDFYFIYDRIVDVLTPLAFAPSALAETQRSTRNLKALGRLKPGTTIKKAQADMDRIAARLAMDYPEADKGWGLEVTGLHSSYYTSIADAFLAIVMATLCVLLIACANVANLLLVRFTTRRKEIAIRVALGASRKQLFSQLLTESALLGLAGGLVGTLFSWAGVRLLVALSVRYFSIPGTQWIALNGTALAFCLVLAGISGLIFGVLPCLHTSKIAPNESLKQSGAETSTGASSRMRGALVISEIALAMVLLTAAGLLTRTFLNLLNANLGFDPKNVLIFDVSLPAYKYKTSTQQVDFLKATLSRFQSLPGVEGTAGFMPGARVVFKAEGQPPNPPSQEPNATVYALSPNFIRVMRANLIAGREFTQGDDANSLPVAIINETLGRLYFPNANPVGLHLLSVSELYGESTISGRALEIVGVVKDIKTKGATDNIAQIYLPYTQYPAQTTMIFVLRTATPSMSLVSAVAAAVRTIDNEAYAAHFAPLQESVMAWYRVRFPMVIVEVFAGIALVLSAVGIFGLISFSVTQRTHEIGIRIAMGAQRRDMLGMVIREGMLLAGIGVAVGVAGAFAVTRVLQSLLFGITATDPASFVGVSLLLAIVTLLACYLPARRAMRVDPMVALRYE